MYRLVSAPKVTVVDAATRAARKAAPRGDDNLRFDAGARAEIDV
jgi:hypothetical protein